MRKKFLIVSIATGLVLVSPLQVSAVIEEKKEEVKNNEKGLRKYSEELETEDLIKERDMSPSSPDLKETGVQITVEKEVTTSFLPEQQEAIEKKEDEDSELKIPLLPTGVEISGPFYPEKKNPTSYVSKLRSLRRLIPPFLGEIEKKELTQVEKDSQQIEKIEKKIEELKKSTKISENNSLDTIVPLLEGGGFQEGGVLTAYRQARLTEKNNPIMANLHRRRGQALEALIEVLMEKDDVVKKNSAPVAYYQEKTNGLEKATVSWKKAADSYTTSPEASSLYEKSALSFEKIGPVLKKDPTIARLHYERGRVLAEAGESCNASLQTENASLQTENVSLQTENASKTEIYRKRKVALIKREAALKKEIEERSLPKKEYSSLQKVAHWQKIGGLLGGNSDNPGAAWAYRNALATEDPLEQALHLKSASHFERSAELFEKNSEREHKTFFQGISEAELHHKVAMRWGGNKRYPGAAFFRRKFNEAVLDPARKKEAFFYQEASRSLGEAAEALINKDEERELLSLGCFDIWSRLAQEITVFSDEELQTPLQHDIQRVLEKQASALEQKKNCLDNETLAILYSKSYEILHNIEKEYRELLEDLPKLEVLTLKKEWLLALENQAYYLEKQAESILLKNPWQEEYYKRLAAAWGGDEENPGVASAYRWAAYACEKNYKIQEECAQSAELLKEYAEQLAENKGSFEETQSLQKRALLRGDYLNKHSLYRKAFLDELVRNNRGAEAWNKSILNYELYVEAKDEGKPDDSNRYQLLMNLYGGNQKNPGQAFFYDLAFQARENNEEAEAQFYEEKAEEKKEEIKAVWRQMNL